MNHRGEPILHRLIAALAKRNVWGATRAYQIAQRIWPLGVVDMEIRDNVKVFVDLSFTPEWTSYYLDGYDRAVVNQLVEFIDDSSKEPAVFIDAGAHYGVVSVKLAHACADKLKQVIAVEPNLQLGNLLKENLDRLPVPAQAVTSALAKTSGRGRLAVPDYDSCPEAWFIEEDDHGDIELTCIDDLEIPPRSNLVMKVDVEGAELDVIEGAPRTLGDAASFAIILEAHPKVVERTGIDPTVILRQLNEIRPCQSWALTEGKPMVDTDIPFFEQLPLKKCDYVICSSEAS